MACGLFNSHLASRVSERFSVSPDGIIKDHVTGFLWMVGPDRDMDWYGARSWIENLESGWRMPMKSELWELFEAGINEDSWGPFENTGWNVWAFDFYSTDMSFLFSFTSLDAFWLFRGKEPSGNRAFAVYTPPVRRTLALRDL